MNQRIKIILCTILFIIFLLGANYLLKMRNITNREEKDLLKEKNENEISYQTNTSNEKEGNVLEVNENTFEKEVIQSEKKVLIDFYATWCVPCQILSPIVEEVAKEHDDIKFVRIDVDESQDLANEYGIYSIPTLVVIENGNEIDRTVGLVEKENVEELIGK